MAEMPDVLQETQDLTISKNQQNLRETPAFFAEITRKFRMLALLAAGMASATGCSIDNQNPQKASIDDVPEMLENNDYGPFMLGIVQNIRSLDGKTSVGIYISYSLSEDVQNATITAIGQNGEILYEAEHDIPAGNGDLRFVEPYINGTNTAKFEGAGQTALITLKGTSESGESFEFTVPLTLF